MNGSVGGTGMEVAQDRMLLRTLVIRALNVHNSDFRRLVSHLNGKVRQSGYRTGVAHRVPGN